MNSSTCSTSSRKKQKLGRQLRSGRISLKHKTLRKKGKNQKFYITEELSLEDHQGLTNKESEENQKPDAENFEHDASENDAHENYERENDGRENNERENDGRENVGRENTGHENNKGGNDGLENDGRENNERENDRRENNEHENDGRENNIIVNEQENDNAFLNENVEFFDEEHSSLDISSNNVSEVSSNTYRDDVSFSEKEKRTERLVVKVNGLGDRMNCIEKELKDIKKLLKYRGAQFPSKLTYFENETNHTLLPKIPLLKTKLVHKMEKSINTNNKFKEQLYIKLATIGGASIKNNLIRIFKRLFSAELRTKMCWNGTPDGKKIAFCSFTGILEVLLLAITYNFDHCTEDDIEQECKLRFRQAKKDFDREKEKLFKIQQRKLRQEREKNEKLQRRRKRRERQQF